VGRTGIGHADSDFRCRNGRIGEALNQLVKLNAALAGRISDLPKIVAFRNQLIHGYASVNAGGGFQSVG